MVFSRTYFNCETIQLSEPFRYLPMQTVKGNSDFFKTQLKHTNGLALGPAIHQLLANQNARTHVVTSAATQRSQLPVDLTIN